MTFPQRIVARALLCPKCGLDWRAPIHACERSDGPCPWAAHWTAQAERDWANLAKREARGERG